MDTNNLNQKDLRRTVLRLQKEGWQAPNIAYIARVSQPLVEQILKDNGILM